MEFLRALVERGVRLNRTDEYGNTGLHLIVEACRNPLGALEAVNREIKEKRNEASLPVKQRSPISMEELEHRKRAVEETLEDLFRCAVILMDAGVDPEAENHMLETAHKLAVRAGAKKIAALLDGSLSPEEETTAQGREKIAAGGMTLHQAVRHNDEEAVRTLVGMGEDINAVSEEETFVGLSPLAVACQTCNIPMTSLLLELGADPSLKNSAGEPPVAALFGPQVRLHGPKNLYRDRLAEQLVALLVQHGFDLDGSLNDQGDCLLGLACASQDVRGSGTNSVAHMVVEEAIRLGADVDRKNDAGQTPLMLSCMGNFRDTEDVQLALLEGGADATIADNQSRTALHMACQAGNKDIIRLLHDRGAELDGTDREGMTPLIYAAKYGRSEACRFLLELGADKRLTDEEGHTAFDYAAANGLRDIVALLEDGQSRTDHVGNTVLHQACRLNQSEVVEVLLRTRRSDIDAPNDEGETPLLLACQNQNVYLVEILLKAGADPNRKLLDGFSPLHSAASEGNDAIARALLQGGADANLMDNLRHSALHYATENGFTEIVEQLLMAGAEV